MRENRSIHRFALAAIALLLAACSDSGSMMSPSLNPPSSRFVQFTSAPSGKKLAIRAVAWGGSHSNGQYSVSAFITAAAGGTISLPNADFSITFPPGALPSDLTITVVALGGPSIAYDLLPHGIRFNHPVVATQGLLNTNAALAGFSQTIFGAYLPDGKENISSTGGALAAEIEASITNLNLTGVPISQVWYLNHFSRYILASGDAPPVDDPDSTQVSSQ